MEYAVCMGHTNMRTPLLKYVDSAIFPELVPGGHATYPTLSVQGAMIRGCWNQLVRCMTA